MSSKTKPTPTKTSPRCSANVLCCSSIKLQNLVAEHADEIVTNDEIIADYPLAYCTANFYY